MMIRHIILAFAVLACLSGGMLVAAGMTAHPAAACDDNSGDPHPS